MEQAIPTMLRKLLKSGLNKILFISSLKLLSLRYLVQGLFGATHKYQPNPFSKKGVRSTVLRNSFDRLDLITSTIDFSNLSVIDIGCNEGFFTLALSQRSGLCLGVDKDKYSLMRAISLASINGNANAIFANLDLDEAAINGIPEFDVVLFLSVYHHIFRHDGPEVAKQYVVALARKCKRYMFFETGEPAEENVSWSNDLTGMGDIDVHVRDLLLDCGFKRVSLLGETDSVRSKLNRKLYLAEK